MLCKLTQKEGEILQLMGSVCNVEQVKDEMKYGFEQMCKDIEEVNMNINLLIYRDKQTMNDEQVQWCKLSKEAGWQEFRDFVSEWISEVYAPESSVSDENNETIASVKLTLELQQADLRVRIASLKQRHALELEEAVKRLKH